MPQFDREQPDRVARIQQEWMRERPDLDVSPQGIIGRLHRVAARLTQELDVVFRAHDITAGEFDVLAALRRAGAPFERTPTELAASTMITSGGLTKRVDRLAGAGFVQRHASEHDGRGRVVALTDSGRSVVDEVLTIHMANEHRLVGMLTERDRGELERTLTLWLAALADVERT